MSSISYPVGYEILTVGATAAALTVPANATKALLVVEGTSTNRLRFRVDGTDPTASVGTPLQNTQTLTVEGAETLAAFRAIRADGVDMTLHVMYQTYNPANSVV